MRTWLLMGFALCLGACGSSHNQYSSAPSTRSSLNGYWQLTSDITTADREAGFPYRLKFLQKDGKGELHACGLNGAQSVSQFSIQAGRLATPATNGQSGISYTIQQTAVNQLVLDGRHFFNRIVPDRELSAFDSTSPLCTQ